MITPASFKTYLVSLVLLASGSYGDELKLSDAYQVSGKLFMPYVELSEPFTAWFDSQLSASRVDYYGGMVKTFQMDKEGELGNSYEVAPMTTDTETNVMTCFLTVGTAKSPVSLQPLIPDTTGFQLMGSQEMDGYESEKWTKEVKDEDRVSTYTLWIRWQESDETGERIAVPMRYEMKGYDSLLASHYDHYYLTYDSFTSVKPDPNVFQVPNKDMCGGFPGPGKRTSHYNPMQEFIGEYQHHVEEAWQDFKTTHSKLYSHQKEHRLRKQIFTQNLRFINSHNRKGAGYTLKVNHLADRSDSERQMLKGRRFTSAVRPNAMPFPYSKETLRQVAKELPDNFDWRILGAVTPVKDQATCGSCWSYATTGTVEGAHFLKTGNLVRFSQQSLIDCSWGYGNNGCDGGEDWRSYQWILHHGGLPTEDDYGSYLGADGFCHVNETKLQAKISSYVNVTKHDEQALRVAIFKHGPISVSIDASQTTFDFYSNGVYYESKCKSDDENLDHSVLVIGFGSLNGHNYWLVKNSWSNYWGNQGYVLMSSEKNNCGVMTSPTYVNLA